MKRCLRPQPQLKTYILQYIYKTGNGYALVNANSPNQAESIFLTQTKYRDKYQDLKVISIQESRWLGQETQLVEEGSVNTSGKNAYDLAVLSGFKGTYEEFMKSLKGEKGDPGRNIISIIKTKTEGLVDTYTITYSSGEPQFFSITNGEKGDKGDESEPIDNDTIDNVWRRRYY